MFGCVVILVLHLEYSRMYLICEPAIFVDVNSTHLYQDIYSHLPLFMNSTTAMAFVSLMFRELSNIISWKYTMQEITFMVWNLSWNLYVCSKFKRDIFIRKAISAIHKFQENIMESSRNVSETNLRHHLIPMNITII